MSAHTRIGSRDGPTSRPAQEKRSKTGSVAPMAVPQVPVAGAMSLCPPHPETMPRVMNQYQQRINIQDLVLVPPELAAFASDPQFQQILWKVKEQTMINFSLNRTSTDSVESIAIDAPSRESAQLARGLIGTHLVFYANQKTAEIRLQKVQNKLLVAQQEAIAEGILIEFTADPQPVRHELNKSDNNAGGSSHSNGQDSLVNLGGQNNSNNRDNTKKVASTPQDVSAAYAKATKKPTSSANTPATKTVEPVAAKNNNNGDSAKKGNSGRTLRTTSKKAKNTGATAKSTGKQRIHVKQVKMEAFAVPIARNSSVGHINKASEISSPMPATQDSCNQLVHPQNAAHRPGNTDSHCFFADLPHVDRPELLAELHKQVTNEHTVLVSSPPGTGKTSLLALFKMQYPAYHYVNVDFVDSDSAEELLIRWAGIDIQHEQLVRNSSTAQALERGQKVMVIIDDAQDKYTDTDFWILFVRQLPTWLTWDVKFILCATRPLVIGGDCPTSLQRFRQSVLFSDHEAHELLQLKPPTGLFVHLRDPIVMDAIVRSCGGSVGALRISINGLNNEFEWTSPSTAALLQYYLSFAMTKQYFRCFCGFPEWECSLLLPCANLLIGMFTRPQSVYRKHLSVIEPLERYGLVRTTAHCLAEYTSSLAMRYSSVYLFEDRCEYYDVPKSVYELVYRAIALMSASSLRCATQDRSLTTGVMSQHLVPGLYRCTPHATLIQPQVSSILSSEGRTKGEFDYYIGGDLQWALQVLVHGQGAGTAEHVARFENGGVYQPLGCAQYLVVDIRVGASAPVTVHNTCNNLVVVHFAPTFKTCTVQRGGKHAVTLRLKA